ncbi:MAG TPA: hypothetical protein DGT21_05245 [Armatimonadetes bacterium]|jgi:hypothetical protein|nr:hypothetical protein [Armatimonadota bacterium]
MSCCLTTITMLPIALVLAAIIGKFVLRGRRAAETRDKLAEYEIIKIEDTADLRGQRSGGDRQERGKGALALVPHKLYFLKWSPKVEFEIYVSAMTSVELVKEFMGKPDRSEKGLLQVSFENDAGQPDAMAWQVPEPEQWEAAIREAIAKR